MEIFKSIFKGKINYKYYDMNSHHSNYDEGYYSKPEIYSYPVFDHFEIIHTCDIEKPPFEINEKVYIPELDITVKITDKVRSTDGSIIYNTSYVIDSIENDRTKESLEQANEKLIEEIKCYET